jgi:hypothetical protein
VEQQFAATVSDDSGRQADDAAHAKRFLFGVLLKVFFVMVIGTTLAFWVLSDL